MKTTRFKEFFLIFIALLGILKAGNIMPDPQNPILIRYPNTNFSPDITARFCLDPKGVGMGYNQVIGLVFPISLKATLNFDASLKYSCSLTAGDKTITVKAVKPASATEGNIAYCQLDDTVNTLIAAGTDLTLKVTLLTLKFSSNWVRGMRLFTATSHKDSKIFIDSSPYIGSVALYGDAQAYSTSSPLIEMSSPTLKDKGNSITTIYPESKFDLEIDLTSKGFLNRNDFVITFSFDNTVVKAPTGIESLKISSADPDDKLADKLIGDLDMSLNGAKNIITIKGINEDLVPGRKFTIALKGFVALSANTSNFKAFEMNVYYKNTYSLLVNQKTLSASNIFKVTPNVITLTANHPDSFDIFRSGLFPMKFSFKSANDINTPVNILLQHANAKTGKIEYNMVASTCDFSENDSSFTQTFGSRPVCYPYRTDFEYTGASASKDFNGSAIFFSLKNMKAATNYYVTVWGSADSCGGDEADNFKATIADTMDTTKTQFKFSMTAYNGIDQTAVNESRLSSRPILGQTTAPVAMSNTCWNSMMNLPDQLPLSSKSTNSVSILPFTEANYKALIKTVDSKDNACDVQGNGNTAYCQMTHDVNLYREFTNIKLINHTTAVPTNNYLADLTNVKNVNNTENFLYGTTTVTSNSYLALTFDFDVSASKKIFELIPSPVAYDAATKAGPTAQHIMRVQPGRLEFKFQKLWFTTGDAPENKSPGCYIAWGINDATLNSTKSVMRNFATPGSTADCAINTTNGMNNFLTTYSSVADDGKIDCQTAKPNLDTSNSVLPNGSDAGKANFRILSVWNSSGKGGAQEGDKASGSSKNASNTSFNFPLVTSEMNKSLSSATSMTFGIFSSCMKFNTAPSTIKSLFASVDIQINYLYNLKNTNSETEINKSIPHRAIRLIKLFPEGGVFQDISDKSSKLVPDSTTNYPNPTAANGAGTAFKYHVALGDSSTTTGVCIIEIYGSGLGANADATSTVLAIWIGQGVILETDYNDVAATYPVAPLSSTTVTAYGLQSNYIMNSNSNFYNNKNLACDETSANTQSQYSYDLQQYAATGCAKSNVSVIKKYRSSYHLLMGSLIVFNGIANGAITSNQNADNLLIPVYCNIHNADKGTSFVNGLPTLYMAFLSMTSFNSITSVNRIFSQKVDNDKYTTVISSMGLDTATARSKMTTNKVLTDSNTFQNYLFTLRWADYTSTVKDNDSLMYLYYGNYINFFNLLIIL